MDVNHRLEKELKEKGILIAAHRGTSGGNVIQNTIGAYENALRHGADIIEVDVIQTTDGEFFAFHNGQEPGLVGTDMDIRKMSSKQVLDLKFRNSMQETIEEKVNRLDDILEHFKGRCLINIDRSWFYWRDVIEVLKRHQMDDQIILKSHPDKKELQILEDSGAGLMYLPIVRDEKLLEQVWAYKVNVIGAEVIFETEDHYFASEEFIDTMHRRNMKLWVNAITLNDTIRLSAGHDDNGAILRDMDSNWGWLAEKHYDIIQTDWPLLMKTYLDGRKNRSEK